VLTKTKKGDLGEEYASKVIKGIGYKIISRKFRSKFGEIDIIAKDRRVLKFIEVKTRWSTKFGKPEEAVTQKKLKNIIKTVEYYLMVNKIKYKNYQIEIISIDLSKDQPSFKIIAYS
jgi:putative endonuclease